MLEREPLRFVILLGEICFMESGLNIYYGLHFQLLLLVLDTDMQKLIIFYQF